MRQFSYKRTFIVGFGFLGISIIWPIFNQFIPIFLQAGNPEFERQLLAAGQNLPQVSGLGMAPIWAMFIMTWDNIINVFVQPWVGERSDRTWTRFGRRKPWIILGAPIALIGFVLIPLAQTALAIAVFILITNIGMALFRSPAVAWLGDLFDPDDRSKANGIINLMGGIGGLLAFFGGGFLFEQFGRAAPFFGGAVMMAAAASVALALVKEPPRAAVQETESSGVLANLKQVWRNPDRSGLMVLVAILLWFMAYNAVEAGLSSFAVFTLAISPGIASIYAGMITIAFILVAMPAGFLGAKYGRRRTIQVGLTGLTLFLFTGFFAIQGATTFVIYMVLFGAFWALVNVNSLPLVYDHGDERKIGAYTGLYYFSSQTAAILGPVMGGAMVQFMGSQYRWLLLFGALFMALAWLAMTQVHVKQSQMPATAD